MDIDKVVQFATNHAASYIFALTSTLATPNRQFQPHALAVMGSSSSLVLDDKPSDRLLNPQLIVFVILSIALGTTINALIPKRNKGPNFTTTLLFISISWLAYGTFIHWVCKVLRGRGSYLDTLTVSLRVLAALYVASSFLVLCLASVARAPFVSARIARVEILQELLIEAPIILYFLVNTLLAVAYLPVALSTVHRFGWARMGLIAIPPIIAAFYGHAIYQSTGILPMAPPPPVREVNISGIWHDTNHPNSIAQITQNGDRFFFIRRGVLPNGIGFESSGSGTIVGQRYSSSYSARYQTGVTSTGDCSGTVSVDGARLEISCRDSLLGTFPVIAVRQ